jgi:hypothetical protein
LPSDTSDQPSLWLGYIQAAVNVPMFSASQMKTATSPKPSSSGMRRCTRQTLKWIQQRPNSSAAKANSAGRASGR